MSPDPVTLGIVAGAASGPKGRQAAERGMEEVSKRAQQIKQVLTGTFQIEDQEVTIRCPEQVESISVAFRASPGLVGQKVKFTGGRPRRAHLRPLVGLTELTSEALALTDQGFEIRTSELSGAGLFLLDVEYGLTSPGFLEALVERNAPCETPKGHSAEYWLHAQLKHPKVLRVDYGRFDLRDLDFEVNVGIAEHVKTVVPGSLVRELELAVQLLRETDIHKKSALSRAHTVAMRSRGKGSTTELLGSLQGIFLPDAFKRFVDVRQDFRYGDCERGQSHYETLPMLTWPRSMKVISRTDLSLDRQAAHGTLTYKRDEFLAKVEEIVGPRVKRRER
jgi:hypothetical protein